MAAELVVDLLGVARTLAVHVQSTIDDWVVRDGRLAPPAALAFATISKEIAKGIITEANALLAPGATPVTDQAKALYQRAKATCEVLNILEHSSQRSLHPVLSPMVQSQLSELNIKGEVLVSSVRDMSYELLPIRGAIFDKLVPANVLSAIEWPVLVFRIPHPPLDWQLNHVLMFHEIGHALYGQNTPNLAIPVPTEIDKEMKAAQGAGDVLRQIETHKLLRDYTGVAADWFEELYSDAVGIALAGPSYLLSFCRVLGGYYGLESAGSSHPPTAFRILSMSRVLQQRGLLDHLPAKARSILDDWIAASDDIEKNGKYTGGPTAGGKLLLPILLRELAALHDTIVKEATSAVGTHVYNTSMLLEDLERGKLLNELRIPPIEEANIPALSGPGTPVRAPRIFAICWAAYCYALEKGLSDSDPHRYASVLLESLDAAEALRVWRTI